MKEIYQTIFRIAGCVQKALPTTFVLPQVTKYVAAIRTIRLYCRNCFGSSLIYSKSTLSFAKSSTALQQVIVHRRARLWRTRLPSLYFALLRIAPAVEACDATEASCTFCSRVHKSGNGCLYKLLNIKLMHCHECLCCFACFCRIGHEFA